MVSFSAEKNPSRLILSIIKRTLIFNKPQQQIQNILEIIMKSSKMYEYGPQNSQNEWH